MGAGRCGNIVQPSKKKKYWFGTGRDQNMSEDLGLLGYDVISVAE
jgi:hypothetical protein